MRTNGKNKMYVADAHSLIWYLKEDEQLSKPAQDIFESCDNNEEIIVIPSIALIEAMFICERKKIGLSFNDILLKLKISSNYQTYPLDDEIVFECVSLKLPDPHDRIVVATATVLNAKLTTKDSDIRDSGLVETIW